MKQETRQLVTSEESLLHGYKVYLEFLEFTINGNSCDTFSTVLDHCGNSAFIRDKTFCMSLVRRLSFNSTCFVSETGEIVKKINQSNLLRM